MAFAELYDICQFAKEKKNLSTKYVTKSKILKNLWDSM